MVAMMNLAVLVLVPVVLFVAVALLLL